ncbi:MAG: metallophosphoesterase [Clostridia bacterium]|nr:metallophosphoesterase [Clostridia bacterium]
MKKLVSVFIAALMLFLLLPVTNAAEAPALSFRADGTFTILNLSDPQDDAHPAPDMLRLIELAIETADPDLIVISGDLVEDLRVGDLASDDLPGKEGVNVYDLSGNLDYKRTRKNVEAAVAAVLGAIEKYGVPYAIALGNNDRKVGLSSEDWLNILSAYPHCIFFDESPDDAGGVDYHLSVKGTDGKNALTVWLMDTMRGGVTEQQADWCYDTAVAIAAENGGVPVPALLFQHIYTDDIGNLFEPCAPTDEGAKKSANGFVRLDRTIATGYNDFGYEPGERTYQFDRWKAAGDVMGAFFGHMHTEGFSGVVDGVELGFTYGCEMAKTGPYGFRVFTLDETDVRDYKNKTYRYSGSANRGTAAVSKEADTPYREVTGVSAVFFRLENLLKSLVSAIVYLFT